MGSEMCIRDRSCRSILFHLDENEKMMLDQINRDEGVNLLQQIGLGTHWEQGKQTFLFFKVLERSIEVFSISNSILKKNESLADSKQLS